MIVMPIAYGRPYIDCFFDRCLPSLMAPHNFPALRDEPLTLFFAPPRVSPRTGAKEYGRAAIGTFRGSREHSIHTLREGGFR
jgi:hypothetical protein